ncbi:MAG: ectoine/hydroxyectoine ABC transporter permease subunit EhuD [Dehalococcoidia bacterium]|nr:ectoine/hydroxyectoine ABC transporter permease subunit EhuD [Dehalococcoidia bacterium]
MTWDWEFAWRIMPRLLEGLVTTVQATLLGITLAMVLGLVLAMLRRSEVRAISWPTAWVVEFIRSTPLLVQLYFLYFVGPTFGLTMGALTTGVLGLGLHYATYTSEVYRAGIESVPRGQWEASTALNLSPVTTWGRVVLPQAIPVVIPALGNYLIAMFKDVPLLATITVLDVLGEARAVGAQSFRYLEPYTLAGLLFLAVSIPASILVRQLEVRLARRP